MSTERVESVKTRWYLTRNDSDEYSMAQLVLSRTEQFRFSALSATDEHTRSTSSQSNSMQLQTSL